MISNPSLLFLGSGTSAGVPAIGCKCNVCLSNDSRDNRLRSSITVSWTDPQNIFRQVLVDASPDLRQQSLKHNLKRIDSIFFTHQHVDHTFGLDEIRRFNVVMGSPIDIYAEPIVIEYLHQTFGHIFYKTKNHNQSFVANVIEHEIIPGKPVFCFGLKVAPIRLLHGRLPILGFRFDAHVRIPGLFPFAYCTDVSSIPPESWGQLENLEILVLDMLRRRHHPTHMSLERSVSLAAEVKAKKTWFIHMSHDLSHKDTQDRLPKGMYLSFDGLEIFPDT